LKLLAQVYLHAIAGPKVEFVLEGTYGPARHIGAIILVIIEGMLLLTDGELLLHTRRHICQLSLDLVDNVFVNTAHKVISIELLAP
jgi:hypothetical protein